MPLSEVIRYLPDRPMLQSYLALIELLTERGHITIGERTKLLALIPPEESETPNDL